MKIVQFRGLFCTFLEYGEITNHDYDSIWESKIPLKVKVFLWLLKRNKLLTKEYITLPMAIDSKRLEYGKQVCLQE